MEINENKYLTLLPANESKGKIKNMIMTKKKSNLIQKMNYLDRIKR